MILRSLSFTLLLFLVWSLAVSLLPKDLGWEAPLWNENVALGQEFLYGDPPDGESVVVLGTSLTERLPLDSLAGRKVYPLAFGGQGILDGLPLVEALKALPEFVMIEANLTLNSANDDFASSLLHPVGEEVRRYLPALRQRNQPVTVLMGCLYYAKNGPSTEQPATDYKDRPVNEAMLNLRRSDYAAAFPDTLVRNSLTKLYVRLTALRERGTRIVFFEVPVHPELCPSPRATALRTALTEVFPADEFPRLPQPDCSGYRTTDGHHLIPASAEKYTSVLDRQLRGILR